MKFNYKSLAFLFAIVSMVGLLFSCAEDDSSSGKPVISYVRITKPESADSLLVASYQGNMVAIIGQNLQNTREVWFNDRKAELSPVLVTETSIITIIPGKIPTKINNMISLVTSKGDTIKHPFEIIINEPVITSMRSEYVLPGGTALIRGNFFYEPMTVTFTGGVEGTVTKVTDDQLVEVVVPEGAEPGPITITTNFGEATSSFWFLDNRNIFLSSDPFKGFEGEAFVETEPGPDDPQAINGNYIHIKKVINAWEWTPVAQGYAGHFGDEAKNIPAGAILNPSDYNLKFEVNTLKPFDNNGFKMQFGLSEGWDAGWGAAYVWMPPYDSKGEWETVVIPLEVAWKGLVNKVKPEGYDLRFLFHAPGLLDADISFDNFRIVPKK